MTGRSPDREPDPARRRFAIIQLVRLAGIAGFLAGITALAGSLAWPRPIGMTLVAAGAFGTFLVPRLLARRWHSDRLP